MLKFAKSNGLSRTAGYSRRTPGPSSRLATVADVAPNPGGLRMRLYVPDSLTAKAPLVVVLHGCTQTADGYVSGAGWLTLSERHGFAVLCPEQTRGNNANLCFNWFEPGDTTRGMGETASIHAMVQRALSDHDLDRDRVFITGLSAGGAMAAVLLASYPETFAGGAVIAGLPYGSAQSMLEAFEAMRHTSEHSGAHWGDKVRAASAHRGGWPTLSIWHGEDDATVHPGAGEALARQWADVHAATDGPHAASTGSGRSYLVWRSAEDRTVVELHRIAGMAHGTPLNTRGIEGVGTAGPFLLDVGISSSEEIAASWGIASNRNTAVAPSTPRDKAADSLADSRMEAVEDAPHRPRHAPSSVAQIIEDALRAAGLMK